MKAQAGLPINSTIELMEIKQRAYATQIGYEFDEDRLRHSWQDSSGSRSFSVGYGEISRDRQTLTERNAWLRNAGLFWMGLGVLLTIFNYYERQSATPSFWLFIGAACYIAYHFRSTHYTIIPSDKGNLLVIMDADGDSILREIEKRRADFFLREYDFFPENEHPEQLRKRFNWLHEEGALSDDDLANRLRKVDENDPTVQMVRQVLASHQPPLK